MYFLYYNFSEIEQSLASLISDRATDEVLDALTRYRRGLGITDTPSVQLGKPHSIDIKSSARHNEASQVGTTTRQFPVI